MVIKKFLFATILGISTLAHSIIIDIQTFTKQMPDGTTQTVYIFGDSHQHSPLNQKHMFRIFKLAQTLGVESTAFIVEDSFASLNTEFGEHISREVLSRVGYATYLWALSLLSARCNFATTNIEFRRKPYEISSKYDCYVYAKEAFDAEIKKLTRYNDSIESNLFYAKSYKDAYRGTKELLTFSDQFHPVRDFAIRPAIVQLVDAAIMHAIHSYNNQKNIIVCAGAAHTARIANLLKANHYIPQIIAGEPNIGKECLSTHDYELMHDKQHPDTDAIELAIIRQCTKAIDPEGAVQKDITDTLRAITIFGHDKAAELRLMPKPLAMARL